MFNLLKRLRKIEKYIIKFVLPVLGIAVCLFILGLDIYNDRQTKQSVKESLSALLEEPLVKKQAISVYKIASSLEKTIEGLNLCIIDQSRSPIYGKECDNAYETLPFSFYPSTYKVSIEINSYKRSLPIFLFIAVIIITLIFSGNQLTNVVKTMSHDLGAISTEENKQLLSREFNELAIKIKERSDLKSKLESARKENEYAQELRNISHDIKSPLYVLEYVLEKAPLNEGDAQLATQAFGQINGVSNAILEKSKKKNSDKHNLLSFLNVFKANKVCEYRNQNFNLKFDFQISDKTLANFDIIKMQSILSNILNNAVEAASTRDEPSIAIKATETASDLFIQISDNGEGIALSAQAKVFERNFTTKSTGNGIGLHTAKVYISRLKGDIDFETSSEGTQFNIRIPKNMGHNTELETVSIAKA